MYILTPFDTHFVAIYAYFYVTPKMYYVIYKHMLYNALFCLVGRSPQICTVCNSVILKNQYPLSQRKNIKNPSFICAKDDEKRYGQPPRPFYNILDVTLLQFWGGI